ncbi:glutamate 5-kinase [Kineosphaera limosa]|uniref:glutamate 5-kinase n=1 Tax=Kineosphaera limosa TaxID=111564 RepID=UPI0018018655|nr:glutamate 5-kinase [Kineosphaera limosa]
MSSPHQAPVPRNAQDDRDDLRDDSRDDSRTTPGPADSTDATQQAGLRARATVAGASRLVVKVGSSSLTDPGGLLAVARLERLADALAVRRSSGTELVLVSSGAIAAGLGPLGMSSRPRDLAAQQAAASVGQGALVAAYSSAFGRHGLHVGLVLLTVDDLIRQQHYVNARRAVTRLLRLGVMPVVNENDAVATDEMRFGDNDRLAALVAHLVRADALVLLTDVDGLYDGPPSNPGSRPIATVRSPRDLEQVNLGGVGSRIGTGGMVTKVEAGRIATGAGITTVLAHSADVDGALAGQEVGTVFLPTSPRPASRMLWLAHASEPVGGLVIDDGAVRALREKGASLLPAGVVGVTGSFEQGSPVEIRDRHGRPVARGLVTFGSDELPRLLGRSTRWLGEVFGPDHAREVVHRDRLALLDYGRDATPS